jgi:hypothetical protein
LAEQRVQFAHEHGLNHIIIWEIAQDVHPDFTHADPNKRSLLRAAYEMRESLLPPVPGDYDGDRNVDVDDFNLWRSTFGSQEDLRADGNGDLIVNAADYVIWRKYSTAAGSGAASASIPEPSAFSLLFFLLFLTALRSSYPRRTI